MARQAKRKELPADSLPSLLGKVLRKETVTADEVKTLAASLEARADRLGATWQEPGHFDASRMLYEDAKALHEMRARILAGHDPVPEWIHGPAYPKGSLVRCGQAIFRALKVTASRPRSGKEWLRLAGEEPAPVHAARRAKRAWPITRDLAEPDLPRVIATDEDRKAYARRLDWGMNETMKGMESQGLDPDMTVTLEMIAPISGAINALTAFVAELSRRVAEIEAAGIKFMGTWQRAMGYRRGSVVTHQGSAWCAIRDHEDAEEPGRSATWQLMVKKGADGKDAK